MSKNYDLIATVDIDIETPIVDDTSFDNLLIVGPLPKVAPAKAPPKIGAYASLDEVIGTGWSIDAEDPDPVGLAAQVAFSQSPTPGLIYIAPMQVTEDGVAKKGMIESINELAGSVIGQNPGLTGCTIDLDGRVLSVALTGAVGNVKNTGVFDFLSQIISQGYTVKVNGKLVPDAAAFKELSEFEELAAMKKGGDAVQMLVTFTKDKIGVDYGVVVTYPDPKAVVVEVPFTAAPLENPNNDIESAVDALRRAMSSSGWYVACAAGVPVEQYEAIAAYIESQEKMFAYTELNCLDGEECEPAVGNVYYRTLAVYGKETSDQSLADLPPANEYINVAFVAKWLNYSSGSETTAFKSLSSVYPSALSSTEMGSLVQSCINYYVTVGNKNLTLNGKVMAGEWADIIRFRDWLKNDMQVRVVNLFVMNPKIPYTDNGISLVDNAMQASLRAGQEAGGIAPEEFDEDGNAIPGFETSVPLAASLSASEKASRKLTKCKFRARLAGAIHFAELKGSLTYTL